MSDENIRVIEINGIKLEVDLRTAKRIDTFRVGSKVRVLVKSYGETYYTYNGIIAAFDNFEKHPAITVCYIESNGNLIFKTIVSTEKDPDIEIAAMDDDTLIDKADIVEKMTRSIEKKRVEYEDEVAKLDYFNRRFAEWFPSEESE